MRRSKERIQGTPEQRGASAKEIVNQACALYMSKEDRTGEPFISEDPRLPHALKILGHRNLEEAITEERIKERQRPPRRYPY